MFSPSAVQPPRVTRVLALLLLFGAVAAGALTVVAWRADAAAQRGQPAQAVRWRPDVPLYRRQWAESLLPTAPAQALVQLREVKREDPFDGVADADLTLADLAAGDAAAARAAALRQDRLEPGFESTWQLANLALAEGDRREFWRQAARSCLQADPTAFASIVQQGLQVSGGDFDSVFAILPAASAPATLAIFHAALSRRDPAAATAFHRLLALPDPAVDGDARAAARAYLSQAWQSWPEAVEDVWNRGRRGGLFFGPDKNASSALLIDAGFDPAHFDPENFAGLVRSPRPAALTSLMGWQWTPTAGIAAQPIDTGDAAYPTAAAIQFDGSENADADLDLVWQWVLAPADAALAVDAASRRLNSAAAAGLSLRLETAAGTALAELPLAPAGAWQFDRGTFHPAAGAAPRVSSYRLALHYRRPPGQLPLRNTVLVTAIHLQPLS